MKLKKLGAALLAAALVAGSCMTASAAEIPQETCTVDYKQTSSSVKVTTKMDGDTAVIDLVITEEAKGDQVLALSDIIQNISGVRYMPGDIQDIKVNITNQSGHAYRYKNNSFVLAPLDSSELGSLEEGSLLPILGFDGQYLALRNVSSMLPKYFYKDVFGVSNASKVTFEMMCGIYDALKAKGYDTIAEYLADHYGYDSWEDLIADRDNLVNTMCGSKGTHNGIYTVTEDQLNAMVEKYPWLDDYLYVTVKNGKLNAQIKWPEAKIAAFSHDYFYNRLFFFAYGSENVAQLNPNYDRSVNPIRVCNEFTLGHSLADYQTGKTANAEANAFFANLLNADAFANGSKVSFDMAFALNGPEMNNQYQNYAFGYYNTIELEQADGDVTVSKVDPDGKAVNGAKFVVGRTVNGNTQYLGQEGNWVASEKDAKVFVSQNGSFAIEGLVFGDYFLKETEAPDGYILLDGTVSFTVDEPAETLKVVNKPEETEEIPDESTPLGPPSSNPTPSSKPSSKPSGNVEIMEDEEVPLSGSPKTGVESDYTMQILFVAAGAAGLLSLLLLRKKNAAKEKTEDK